MARASKYLTLAQAAEHLGVSTKTVRTRIAEGRLKAYRIGPRSIRVSIEDLEELARPIPTAHSGAA